MKEITPTGWLIDDGGAWQFTTKSEDLAVAKRFNWKITPLYSEQALADIRAEAVIEFNMSTVFGHGEGANKEYCRGFDEALEQLDNLATTYANKIKGAE